MFLDLIVKGIAAVSGLIVSTLLVHALTQVYKVRRARNEFLRKSKGIRMAPHFRSLGGHIHKITVHPRNWQNVANYHQQLGDTFGFMSNSLAAVSTLDLDVIKLIAIDEGDLHVNRTRQLGIPFDEMEIDEILLAEDDQWRRLRKNMAPAFSNHKMKAPNVRQEIQTTVEKFVESIESRLDSRVGKRETGPKNPESSLTIDAEDILNRYILALVFTCFYKQDNLVDFYGESDYWQKISDEGLREMSSTCIYLTLILPILRPIVQFIIINFHRQGEMRRKIIEFIKRQTKMNLQARKQIQAAKASDVGGQVELDNMILQDGSKFRRNMIDYVIDKFHEGNITTREYIHSTFLIFFAANKTTADGLSKFMYLISKHTDIQEKLRSSILIEGIDSEYLSWCINEALRLFPPIHFGCTRIAARDIETADGKLIPKGTLVLTHNHTIHRLEKYWGEDAEEYKPERWANAKNFHPAQFLAFGAGKRNCLGKDFALHAIKILTVNLLRQYKFEYVSGPNDDMMFEAPFFTFCCFDGPTNIKITRI